MNYDTWKASVPEADEVQPTPCPVCTGDNDADPCSEECDALIKRCERERRIVGIYIAAKGALWFARLYKTERYHDRRVDECVARVNSYRAEIRALRGAA